jgi:S1-C subfamily serine protease
MADANGQPISLGSGFFVRDGIVATNLHVIERASSGYVKIIGQQPKYPIAGIVGSDPEHDLVLLKVSASAPALQLGEATKISVGDEVFAIGNPLGLEGTLSQGIVSGIRQVGSDTLLQITAPISPGSSGGPVLTAQGDVVGVAVATFSGGQNLNFAIPVSHLVRLLANMKLVPDPLSRNVPTKARKSVVGELGGRSTEGVRGAQFAWGDFGLGLYSFSLRNQLPQGVKNVRCLVVFYDDSGKPLDVSEPFCQMEQVLPGLAKRVTGSVDRSVQRLSKRVEIRILDFRIIE